MAVVCRRWAVDGGYAVVVCPSRRSSGCNLGDGRRGLRFSLALGHEPVVKVVSWRKAGFLSRYRRSGGVCRRPQFRLQNRLDRPRFHAPLTCGSPKQSASRRFCSRTVSSEPMKVKRRTVNSLFFHTAIFGPRCRKPANYRWSFFVARWMTR